MSLLEMLQKRHSIRKYTDANISDQDLQTILQAGLLSASGRAARPWELIVVRNKETLQKMSESRVGAAKMLANAKKCADENPGYSVYDESGKAVYSSQGSGNGFSPYLVQVSITDLNIRKGPGTNYGKTGKYTGKGVFTIVEEATGRGASRWGKLKSGAGWISLDYAKKI